MQYFLLGLTSLSWKRMIKTSHKSVLPEREIQFPEMKHFLNNLNMIRPLLFTSCYNYDDQKRVNFQKKRVNSNTILFFYLIFFLPSPSHYFHELFVRITHLPKNKVNTLFYQQLFAGDIVHT